MAKILGLAAGAGLAVYGYKRFQDYGKKLNDNQHVVIVGGGYGGTTVAQKLIGRGNYTLIDQREALHHNMAALRAAVEPGFSKKTFIFYKPTFAENFVQGKVVDIDTANKQVLLENRKNPIKYTELVLATGSTGPFPGKCSNDEPISDLSKLYEDFTKEVKEAKKIVIVGGGPVGVEMAGEIEATYPNGQKEIIIVHNSDILVSPKLLPEAREKIAQKLEAKKIQVVYDDKVTNLRDIPVLQTRENIVVKTSCGKEITANLVIPCFGLQVLDDAYKSSLAGSVNERGQLRVNENLEVVGTNSVFAIGDCNNYDVTKLALEACNQANSTYENLIHIAKGQPLVPYKPDTFRMVVPIGTDQGIAQNGSKVFGDFLAKMIKGRDVFVKKVWGDMRQPVPKD